MLEALAFRRLMPLGAISLGIGSNHFEIQLSSSYEQMYIPLSMYQQAQVPSLLQNYRLLLPITIRNDHILLLIDCQKSRTNYIDASILSIISFYLIVYPVHCSHFI